MLILRMTNHFTQFNTVLLRACIGLFRRRQAGVPVAGGYLVHSAAASCLDDVRLSAKICGGAPQATTSWNRFSRRFSVNCYAPTINYQECPGSSGSFPPPTCSSLTRWKRRRRRYRHCPHVLQLEFEQRRHFRRHRKARRCLNCVSGWQGRCLLRCGKGRSEVGGQAGQPPFY